MSFVYKKGRTDVAANLTPMIDVIFLLIVFFVLVSQIVEVENVDLNLPQPKDPLSMQAADERRVVMNVVPDPLSRGAIQNYRLGSMQFGTTADDVAAMIDALAAMWQEDPDLIVNLRADRSTHYEWVEPAMHAISLAAAKANIPDLLPRLNLVVVPEGSL